MSRRAAKPTAHPAKIPGMKLLEGGLDAEAAAREVSVPIVDAVAEDEKFSAPHSLNLDGREMWEAAIRTMRLVGELSKDFLPALNHLCHLHQRFLKKHRADTDIDWRENETYRKLIQEFGLTPASRMRMDPDGSKTRVLGKNPKAPNYNAAIHANAKRIAKQEAAAAPLAASNQFAEFVSKTA